MTKEALIFEQHDGKTFLKLSEVVDAWYEANIDRFGMCQCGNPKAACECPKWGDEWKAALEDRPENQR